MKVSPLHAALQNLQRLMRVRGRPDLLRLSSRTIPKALGGEPGQALAFGPAESASMIGTERLLLNDVRYEHLGDSTADRVWYFACQCHLDPKTDYVKTFLAEHEVEPASRTCYMAVEYLKVTEPQAFSGIRLLPFGHPEVPSARLLPSGPPVASVAAVETVGTDRGRMTDRARTRAEHALRLLRVALCEHRGINDRQLRFRLGTSYAYGEDYRGWTTRDDIAYELEVDADLIGLAGNQAVATLPFQPVDDIDQKADLATRWMERARFAGDPLVALLYLFFALEALLGDTSEGLKGPALAYRQAMLGHVTSAGFTDPNETFVLYDRVRSGAVHGENVPSVGWDMVRSFEVTVRWSLAQYIQYSRRERFRKRSRLVAALMAHPQRQALIDWLRSYAGSWWTEYLATLSTVDEP